jgi:hypothetical protein
MTNAEMDWFYEHLESTLLRMVRLLIFCETAVLDDDDYVLLRAERESPTDEIEAAIDAMERDPGWIPPQSKGRATVGVPRIRV